MRTNDPIPRAEREFHAQGYVVLAEFEASERVCGLRDEVIAAAEDAGSCWAPDADANPLFDVWVGGVEKVSDLAFELGRSERLVGLAERLLGGPIVPLRCSYAARVPRSSEASPWHVDAARYAPHFGDLGALAICLPLTNVGPSAGGLRFLRGAWTTRGTMQGHPGQEMAVPCPAAAGSAVAARPGDAIVYHSFTPHRVEANTTAVSAEIAVFAYRYSPYRHQFGHTLSHGFDESG